MFWHLLPATVIEIPCMQELCDQYTRMVRQEKEKVIGRDTLCGVRKHNKYRRTFLEVLLGHLCQE